MTRDYHPVNGRSPDGYLGEVPGPTVEVVVFTYNHEAYIERALSSVLEQDIDLPLTIRVHDDASRDRTVEVAQVLLAASSRAGEVIRAPENRHQYGIDWFHEYISESEAEFVALLDGDDYWIDPSKLRRQVEMLRAHPEAALCHHQILHDIDGTLHGVDWPPGQFRREILSGDVLAVENPIATSSVLLRRSDVPEKIPDEFKSLALGDYPLWALVCQNRSIAYLDEAMSAYRVDGTGMFSSLAEAQRFRHSLRARLTIMLHVDQPQLWAEGIEDVVGALWDRINTAEGEVESLRDSTSWKVTRPLRTLAERLRPGESPRV